jgi:hypothetical protein
MLESVHLYLEGMVAAFIMTMLGAISGMVTLELSGDQRLALLVASAAFMLPGDRPDGAPLAHDESTGPSCGATRLTGCRTAPAPSAGRTFRLVEGAPTTP